MDSGRYSMDNTIEQFQQQINTLQKSIEYKDRKIQQLHSKINRRDRRIAKLRSDARNDDDAEEFLKEIKLTRH